MVRVDVSVLDPLIRQKSARNDLRKVCGLFHRRAMPTSTTGTKHGW